jgi:hypothetical protein
MTLHNTETTKQTPSLETFIGTRDITESLNCSIRTLDRWIATDRFPQPTHRHPSSNRKRLWKVAVVRDFIRSMEVI